MHSLIVFKQHSRVGVHMPISDHSSFQRRFEQVIGTSSALERVLDQVERVAPTGSTVLIQGETGTGKELIAHAVHNLSSPAQRTDAQ